jgi:3-oxoacyl-[acyl-carrier protein] reductase
VVPDTFNPGRPVGPDTLMASQTRPLVDGNRSLDVGRVTQPDLNSQAESLGAAAAMLHRPSVENEGVSMLLQDKVAVVYGAAGAVGGTVARTFAREGAQVFALGRTRDTVEQVADDIRRSGGVAEAAVVDALDPEAVDGHLEALVASTGRIDISMNATSIRGDLQGTTLRDMTVDDFTLPAMTALRSNFCTGTAAARRMTDAGAGVILTMSTSASGLSGRDRRFHATGGFGAACAAVEEFTRSLAGEVGEHGVRVVCLRPDALPETWGARDTEPVMRAHSYMTDGTAMGRMPTLQEVANAAAFLASERAGAMTGTIVNLTCGSIMNAN